MKRALKHLAGTAVIFSIATGLYQHQVSAASGHRLSQKALGEIHRHLLNNEPINPREFRFLLQLVCRAQAKPDRLAADNNRLEIVRHELIALYQRYGRESLARLLAEPDLQSLMSDYLLYNTNPVSSLPAQTAYLQKR